VGGKLVDQKLIAAADWAALEALARRFAQALR